MAWLFSPWSVLEPMLNISHLPSLASCNRTNQFQHTSGSSRLRSAFVLLVRRRRYRNIEVELSCTTFPRVQSSDQQDLHLFDAPPSAPQNQGQVQAIHSVWNHCASDRNRGSICWIFPQSVSTSQKILESIDTWSLSRLEDFGETRLC